jgi:hypothetical protein
MSLPEIPVPVFFVLVFVAVLAVIGVITWLIRRFGTERFGATAMRNRQPRLAVIDAASVDGRRRLVIIRRDNVEHLLMIGGPTDVVVETNIVRGNATAATREAAPVRAAAVAETLPRPAPLGEGGHWPSPQPEPSVRPNRISIADEVGHRATQPEQAVRTPRVAEDDSQWPLQPQAEPILRAQREPSTPAGPSVEHSRANSGELAPATSRSMIDPTRTPTPSVPPAETTRADQNLAKMANRLEAALRRPIAAGDTRPAVSPKSPGTADAGARIAPDLRARKEPEPARVTTLDLKAERIEPARAPAVELKAERIEPARPPVVELKAERIEPARPPVVELKAERGEPAKTPAPELKAERNEQTRAATPEAKPAAEDKPARPPPKLGRTESKFGQPKPVQPKTLYDSLEQEMASLLGRPGGKG